jgi:ABC-type bacteriocin/lantibiotic exporter with double-glycine peptidase domain
VAEHGEKPKEALSLKQLMPSKTQRMLIVGTTGCGKTTLARHLLAQAPYECILVVDP